MSMRLYKWIFVTLLFVPMFWLANQAFHSELGANPPEKINLVLGDWTYYYLASNLIWGALLAIGWVPQKLRRFTLLRRHLGVVTFVYVLFHFTFYVLKEGDIQIALAQTVQKLYLILGLTGLIILFLLAMTSNNFAVRKLKGNWKKLHRLAYLVLPLATIHYFLIEKKDWRVTIPWLVVWIVLSGVRVFKAVKKA